MPHDATDEEDGRDDPTEPPRRPDDGAATTRAIERALRRLAPSGASVSALAVTADGSVLASRRPGRAVAPASNTKLLTAALALAHLGPDHRFRTTVAGRGTVENRLLDGDLVLRGSGAPDLAPAALATLADRVADRVDGVTGDIVCDPTRFDGPQLGPGRVWTDVHHAYGARSSALALSGNVVDVTVDTADGAVSVVIDPATVAIDIGVDVEVTPAASTADGESNDDDGLTVRPTRGPRGVRVTGRLPADATGTVRVPVDRPVRHCGLTARAALSDAGVDVSGSVRVADSPLDPGTELGVVTSAPVGALLRTMNVESDNFVADQFARTVAATATGTGSWDAWGETVADHLATLGVETVRITDGSGLSRYNRIPAGGLVALLEWVDDQPWSATYFESLPEPGEGTLADRLDGVPVVAKTGTLTGARALSGRVGDGADAVLFSVLVGDITVDEDTVRERQDAFVRALAARSDRRQERGDGSR